MSLKLKEENKIILSFESLIKDIPLFMTSDPCWPLTLEGM
jgi:hypothetical protein